MGVRGMVGWEVGVWGECGVDGGLGEVGDGVGGVWGWGGGGVGLGKCGAGVGSVWGWCGVSVGLGRCASGGEAERASCVVGVGVRGRWAVIYGVRGVGDPAMTRVGLASMSPCASRVRAMR